MEGFWSNRIELDYVQLSLLAASYFILNYENMAISRGRYIYDLRANQGGCDIIITAVYTPSLANNDALFSFKVDSVNSESRLSFRGVYDVACSYAKDFIGEYIARVKK